MRFVSKHNFLQLFLSTIVFLLIAGVSIYMSRTGHFQSADASVFSVQGASVVVPDRRNSQHFLRDNPDALLQMSLHDIVQNLHEPELVRSEGAVTLFQYRSDACVLDLYFEGHGVDLHQASVMYYEARPREEGDRNAPLAPCVADLLRKIHKPRMVDVSAIFKAVPSR